MQVISKVASCLVVAASVVGCGGGGDAPSVAPRSAGILSGAIERDSQTYEMRAIATDSGRFMAYDSGGWFYDGTYQVPGTFVTGHSVTLFEADPGYLNDGASFDHMGFFSRSVDLVDFVLTDNGARGSLVLGESQPCPACAPTPNLATFELVYDRTLDALDSSFSMISGNWTFANGNYRVDLAVTTGGATSTASKYQGTSIDCGSGGAASLLDASYNAYGWATTPSGSQCGDSSAMAPYDGLAFVSGTSQEELTILLNNGPRFLAFKFVRPPPP